MAHHDMLRHLSRRSVLKTLTAAPFLFRPSPVHGSEWFPLDTGQPFPPGDTPLDTRFVPSYPARSPLEDVLRRVKPGSDEFVLEGYAFEIGLVMDRWRQAFKSGAFRDLLPDIHPAVQFSSLAPAKETRLRSGGVETFRGTFSNDLSAGVNPLMASLQRFAGSFLRIVTVEFEITGISVPQGGERVMKTDVRYSFVSEAADRQREQRIGMWIMHWAKDSSAGYTAAWQVLHWQAAGEERSVLRGPGFQDVTEQAFAAAPSYREQMLRGSDEWRTVLDAASGIDVYGNNGIAAGDYNGDGFDDLYVCQPAGLPNRLYRNRGDGTFEDVTEAAGVGVLDNTACALFADFRNIGLQDLLVVCGSGPLIFINRGDGTFTPKRDAFQFIRPPQGTFTHAAVADYDRDGRLDVYFCLYSYYLGLDQYHYPAPYFDARNGPPNFLFHNQGDGTFTDRTQAAGLNAENDRYSFACAWGENPETQRPDLYVVNDFGRNNLYRNNGDGTFAAVSTAAHVQDVGAGMSAAWGDYNNDGRPDLYVANMWSASGQRVSTQPNFHAEATEDVRKLYQQHARGNTMYRNEGTGTFRNVSRQSGLEAGRWAWCSDFVDFDHDGYADLYVTNGYITAPGHAARNTAAERSIDLGSFFWRQVVAKSSNDATPSLAYEHGWNALNELIRTDHSWSGNEPNVMFVNNRDGTFSEVSGALGVDYLEDSRSFALADLDGDGRLEIVLKNRNAPQLRVLRNAMEEIGRSIVIRLRGTRSNRDAIGTSIIVTVGDIQQTKSLQAGSGFLAQHSKDLHFGVSHGSATIKATVRWPSGLVQHFDSLPHSSRIHLQEGDANSIAEPFASPSRAYATASPVLPAPAARRMQASVETWLLDPLKAPAFSLPDLSGQTRAIVSLRGQPALLLFWSVAAQDSVKQLRRLQASQSVLNATGLTVLSINVDGQPRSTDVRALAARDKLTVPILIGSEEITGIYNIIFRYLFDRRHDLALPTGFLLDREGLIVKVYQGQFDPDRLASDARNIPSTAAGRMRIGLPFTGLLHEAKFSRNDFTYGIAFFQHGYLDQAEASFRQVVAARPNDAEGYYNLGTLNLRRNNYSEAEGFLRRSVLLKPDYPEAWNNLGMLAAQQGQTDDAIRNFKQSLALRPTYATALLNLGNLYRRQRDFSKAKEYLMSAVELQPDDPEIIYSLGMLLAQENSLQAASDYLQRAIALRPDYVEAFNNLGVIAVRSQDLGTAESQFKAAIRLNPGFDDAYLNLARLYVLQHDAAKAEATLESLLLIKPESVSGKQALRVLRAQP